MSNQKSSFYLLLFLPTIAWFYIGLFLTMQIWYPAGLEVEAFNEHVFHFTVVYLLWLLSFFVYTLFDLKTFQKTFTIVSRLIAAMVTNAVIAITYFYFQPELIITPRRFLLVHLGITLVGLLLWFFILQQLLPKVWKRSLYLHPQIYFDQNHSKIEQVFAQNTTLGWKLEGKFNPSILTGKLESAAVLLPALHKLDHSEIIVLFKHKQQGLEFVDYHQFYELTQRTVELNDLNEAWFLHSVSYSQNSIYDFLKRFLDLLVGLLGSVLLLLLLPLIGILIKLDSPGSTFFVQSRVGQNNIPFRLYKFRTMSGGATDTWTSKNDLRITRVGHWLRVLRIDELPQFFNILRGDMSLVGPRPEQVHIAKDLAGQIPYYNERHNVKPGLTGWAQLHVYAATVAESKQKLEYDLYYIKHRSIWFDIEIVLRTVFHFLTMQGR